MKHRLTKGFEAEPALNGKPVKTYAQALSCAVYAATNLRQADIPKDIAQVDPKGYPTAIRRSTLAKALGENAADASDETLAALFEARGSLAGAADYMLRDIASVTENGRRIAAYRDVVGRRRRQRQRPVVGRLR